MWYFYASTQQKTQKISDFYFLKVQPLTERFKLISDHKLLIRVYLRILFYEKLNPYMALKWGSAELKTPALPFACVESGPPFPIVLL